MSQTAQPTQSSVWELEGPFHLRNTLGIIARGPADPTVQFTPQAAWFAFNTPGGPATLCISHHPERLMAQAWGPGAEYALAMVPALSGSHDDWSDFDSPDFTKTLPDLARQARRRNLGTRLPSTGRVVDALVPAILEQKVTSLEAQRGYARLLRKFGSSAPGVGQVEGMPPHLMVAPTAQKWAQIPSWEWHAAGVGPQRSATVMRVLRSASALEKLAALPAAEAAAKMQSIPGVGLWTAAEVTQRTHGDPDQVAVGDYHLASFVGWALVGKKVDDAGMLELLEPWRGHRQRVVRMLYLSGFRKPAFGPRMTIQDHRGH